MKFSVFSSGSEGNCTLLRTNKVNILIDAGITRKQIVDNLARYNMSLKDIDTLLITHEHSDHIKALPTLLKECDLKLLMSAGTYDSIINYYVSRGQDKLRDLLIKKLNSNQLIITSRLDNSIFYPNYQIEDLDIQVLPAFHDAKECIGFSFKNEGKKFVYLTDTGYVHQALYDEIANANAYLLESNHDPELLMASNRPYPLKVRILSDHGHMSNEDSMITLANIIGEKTSLVLHAHISQECNLKEILIHTRERIFQMYGLDTKDIEFHLLNPYFSGDYEI